MHAKVKQTNVRFATDEDKESWNRFVLEHSGNPCYLYEWRKILEEVYMHA